MPAPATGNNLASRFLVKRRAGMTFDDFCRHSREIHAPMVAALPGLRRYVVAFYPGEGEAPSAFDSSATLEFDDAGAFGNAMNSPEAAAALADQEEFLDVDATVVLTGEIGYVQA